MLWFAKLYPWHRGNPTAIFAPQVSCSGPVITMCSSTVHAGSISRPGSAHSFIEGNRSHIDGFRHGEYLHFPHLGHRYEKWFSAYSLTISVFVWQSRQIGGSGSFFNCTIPTSGYPVVAVSKTSTSSAIFHTECFHLGFVEHSENTVFEYHLLTPFCDFAYTITTYSTIPVFSAWYAIFPIIPRISSSVFWRSPVDSSTVTRPSITLRYPFTFSPGCCHVFHIHFLQNFAQILFPSPGL